MIGCGHAAHICASVCKQCVIGLVAQRKAAIFIAFKVAPEM